MPPDRNNKHQICEILKQATPSDPEPMPDDPGPSLSEIRIRIRVAFYAAITAFSLAAFFMGGAGFSAQMDLSDRGQVIATTLQIPSETTPAVTRATFTDLQIRPIGKITSPIPEAITGRTITITGYTENVPFDTPFVWLIVDVPSIGRCWPKKPLIQPNGTFQTTIFEGGPNMDYTVSLYAAGYGLNKTIEQWLAAESFGGLPMIPQQYRLDSVKLSLNGV